MMDFLSKVFSSGSLNDQLVQAKLSHFSHNGLRGQEASILDSPLYLFRHHFLHLIFLDYPVV